MTEASTRSPFHRGEREIQSRLGVREQVEDVGQRFIRDYMPDQHREFFEQLPMLLIGSMDAKGRPWASVVVGCPGFVRTPDPKCLQINARTIYGDPLKGNLAQGSSVGILGIEYTSRRRNRMTGEILSFDDEALSIRIDQTFGNCPQYIQSRDFEFSPEIDRIGDERPVHQLRTLDDRAQSLISQADNFYIATYFSEDSGNVAHGADVSHRGGKPGFVSIDDDKTLTFPDYTGNYHFNTLGNILLNPLAGLLFIDFTTGDLLYLTCSAEIIWDSEETRAFAGAQRLVRFTLDEGVLVTKAMPIRWDFIEYSPSLEQTGSWEEVEETIAARKKGNAYRNYTVTRVERESDVITSFYLEPEDEIGMICHKAGQFLPIEIVPPGSSEKIRRTYTISNAPNRSFYRLTIKREPPASPELPPGVSSNFFHDQVTTGTTIHAMSPRGQFTLEESTTRPVVLLSAGVGVTPMISMLEQLRRESATCGCTRNVWFIHAARNSKVHAFSKCVRDLAKDWPCLTIHVRYSDPSDSDVEGEHHDSTGHVDVDLLKTLLPFGDYDFYLCGPTPFMESLYEGLKDLNVADERIHYEFFGKGSTLKREQPGASIGLAGDLSHRDPVAVRFAKSDKQATWEPSKGTLLDLAEAEGLRPAYSCRSGICQTCSTRVVSGDVDYLAPPMAEPENGEALICCSYPAKLTGAEGELILDL